MLCFTSLVKTSRLVGTQFVLRKEVKQGLILAGKSLCYNKLDRQYLGTLVFYLLKIALYRVDFWRGQYREVPGCS